MVGNLKNYTKIDILRCLLRIEKPVSRAELSRILDLGEGTVRSILDILKENNFLESNKNGHYLSPKGDNFVQKIKNNIERDDKNRCKLRMVGWKVMRVWEHQLERDQVFFTMKRIKYFLNS